ncbi:carbohydrate ABC transporter permease [Ruthenibacterium lactatiformans]|uniref:carbohydrate ABC transporter permease n=1 Tax=Ruthenibacterium lactatiformans TaxID=1550024 RepID=UPI003AB91EF4
MNKPQKTLRARKALSAVWFCTPAVSLLTVFLIIPSLMALFFSFTDFYTLRPDERTFVGISNYVTLFEDSLFWTCLRNTAYFTVVLVPIEALIALLLAMLINTNLKGQLFFRTSFFMPVITSITVVSILWTFLYNPSNGLINALLNSLSLPSQRFLRSADQAMNSIIVMTIWQGVGYQMIIFLAGLKDIPRDYYEASAIDGAGKFRQFTAITLPCLKNVISFIVIYVTIQAFKLFVQPYIMTNGGPQNSTRSLVQYIYQQGFQYKKAGFASAASVIFFLIVVLVSGVLKLAFLNHGEAKEK